MLETLALETLCGGQCTCTLQTQLIKQIIWFSLLCFALLYKHQVQMKIYPMISAQQQQRHSTQEGTNILYCGTRVAILTNHSTYFKNST